MVENREYYTDKSNLAKAKNLKILQSLKAKVDVDPKLGELKENHIASCTKYLERGYKDGVKRLSSTGEGLKPHERVLPKIKNLRGSFTFYLLY